ncbi:MAG: glutathione S-transferase family protein [Kordiimonadaceae bacterium]|nr:glutathione S-transferase family protein [Kordiimonadaceae bacterium]
MSMKCYFISGSPFAWRALFALEAVGAPYEAIELHGSKGDLKTPEFLAMNPRGKVPVLLDGDIVVYESAAILTYLDHKYPSKGLFGKTAAEAGLVTQRSEEIGHYLMPALRDVFRPVFTGQVDEKSEQVQAGLQTAREQLSLIDAWLKDTIFIIGTEPTAADYTLYPPIGLLMRILLNPAIVALEANILPLADNYPALAAWAVRMEALSGYAAAYPPHWRAAA